MALSVLKEGVFVLCASPIFPLTDPSTGVFTFEVFDEDASSLKSRLGKVETYGVDPEQPPFVGQLKSLDVCKSTHPGLALLRDKRTLRAIIIVHKPESQDIH